MEPIRIVVAEDNEDLRAAIEALLAEEPDMLCVGSTASLAELPPLVRQQRAGVALLDLQLRDGLVMPRLAALCEQLPATRFIIHSGHGNPMMAVRAREAGARAYVAKSGDIEELIATIRSVMQA